MTTFCLDNIPEISEHYKNLHNAPWNEKERQQFFARYDLKTEKLYQKYKRKWGWLIDFLYQPDTAGRITIPQVRKLRKLTTGMDPTLKIGYFGQPDCSTIQDFRDVLNEAVANHTQVVWN